MAWHLFSSVVECFFIFETSPKRSISNSSGYTISDNNAFVIILVQQFTKLASTLTSAAHVSHEFSEVLSSQQLPSLSKSLLICENIVNQNIVLYLSCEFYCNIKLPHLLKINMHMHMCFPLP